MDTQDIKEKLNIIAGRRHDRDSQLEYVAKKTELVSRLVLNDQIDKGMTSRELRKCSMILHNVVKVIRTISEAVDDGE